MRLEPLTEQHEAEGFSCGEASLDRWLTDHALTNQRRSLSRTFVAVDDTGGHPAGAGPVAGYVTLVAAAIEVAQLPGGERRSLVGLDEIQSDVSRGRLRSVLASSSAAIPQAPTDSGADLR